MPKGEKTKKLWKNPEYRKHMKEIHRGLCGLLNPNWKGGRELAEERHKPKEKETMKLYRIKNKEKIREYDKKYRQEHYIKREIKGKPRCVDCGKRLTHYTAGRCRECHLSFNKGENHYNWQDGKSFEPYTTDWTEDLKDSIRKRDNYVCQECGIHQDELDYKLHCHHIDYIKENCNPDNLITLCRSCHIKTNYDREYWTNYFNNKL